MKFILKLLCFCKSYSIIYSFLYRRDGVGRIERIYCMWCVYETLSFMGT
jgi:hypothetical protein